MPPHCTGYPKKVWGHGSPTYIIHKNFLSQQGIII